MTIIDDLLAYAARNSSGELLDSVVHQVQIGLHWTGVYSHWLGLAATQAEASCCYAEELPGAGRLHEQTAPELAGLLKSTRPLLSGVGMAALNSILPVDLNQVVELNARQMILARGQAKNVALVGHFPFSAEIRQAAANCWVLELDPAEGDLPADLAPQILPQADLIGITASTLLNGTFEALANLFPPNALVIMLGPSTPLCPVLFDYGVDVLGGARATDPEMILNAIGQGSALHRPPGLQRLTLTKQPIM